MYSVFNNAFLEKIDVDQSKSAAAAAMAVAASSQPAAAPATIETYKTLEMGTSSDAHLISSLLTKLIHSFRVGGFSNKSYFFGRYRSSLLPKYCPWDDRFRQPSAKIN